MRPVLRAIVYLIAVVCVSLFLYAAFAALLGLLPPGRGSVTLKTQFLFEAAGSIATVGVAVIFRHFLDRRSIVSLGFPFARGSFRLLLLGLAIGAAMQLSVFALQEALGISRVSAIAGPRTDAGLLATFFPLFLIAALFEEMLTRGYVLQNLWEDFGFPAAVAVSAAFFAAIHLSNPNVGAQLVLTLAGLAAFAVWASISYLWTKSLWVALGAHCAWNLFEGPILGFPVSGLTFGHTAVSQSIRGPAWLTGGSFGPEAGMSALIGLTIGMLLLYALYRRGAFDRVFDGREFYARRGAEQR